MRLLNKQGYMPDDFLIREATAKDIAKLAALHVKAWSETYPKLRLAPSLPIREGQWADEFAQPSHTWFCFVIEDPQQVLVGFALGKTYHNPDMPEYTGELNKLYLLKTYQRLGLGRRLVCQAVNKFLERGISSMILLSEATNPAGVFYEKIGGRRLYAPNDVFYGAYGWTDLNELAELCSQLNV